MRRPRPVAEERDRPEPAAEDAGRPELGEHAPPARVAAEAAEAGRPVAVLVAGFLVVLACITVLGILSAMVWRNQRDILDAVATPMLHSLASPWLDAVMTTASFVGTDIVLGVLVGLLVVALLRFRRRRQAALLVVAITGGVLLNGAMKLLFHRARPSLAWAHVPAGYSFPSGHAMNSLTVALAVSLVAYELGGRRAGIVALVLSVAASLVIGASRIYLGAHYLTDVVGGYAAAVLWVAVVLTAFNRWRRYRSGSIAGV